MAKRYRQLLPSYDSNFPNSHPSGSTSIPKRQRIGTKLACDACRKRKIRCDGRQPQCEACRRRGPEPCIYAEDHSKEPEQILELFNFMKTGPESLVIDTLQILRRSGDLNTALSIIQPQIGLTRHASNQQWPPTAATRHLDLESELMARHSLSFPPLQPFESSILKDVLSTGRIETTDNETSDSPSNPESKRFPVHLPTQRSISASGLCDERLEKLDISFWTAVPIPSDLAAKIISLYLETDHPMLGTFDPDLFVNDLIDCETTYCSQLLLSALMYWGCQMYSALDPAAKEYMPQFRKEAERRWSEEKSTDSFLTLAGMQLLGLAYMGDGNDHYILTYMSEANSMGTRLGLFGVDPTIAILKTDESPKLQSATSYAAWGSFNWIVFLCLFYQQPGISYVKYPPNLPIPGNTWHHNLDDSPESVRQTLPLAYMGDTFPVLCRFWRIVHEMTLRYYRDQPIPREGISDHIPLAFAEYKYRELIAWAETLPLSMVRLQHSQRPKQLNQLNGRPILSELA